MLDYDESRWFKCEHSRECAIEIATKYCLEEEVTYCMDELGMTPDEALEDWDLL